MTGLEQYVQWIAITIKHHSKKTSVDLLKGIHKIYKHGDKVISPSSHPSDE